jgi:hypothetical protein
MYTDALFAPCRDRVDRDVALPASIGTRLNMHGSPKMNWLPYVSKSPQHPKRIVGWKWLSGGRSCSPAQALLRQMRRNSVLRGRKIRRWLESKWSEKWMREVRKCGLENEFLWRRLGWELLGEKNGAGPLLWQCRRIVYIQMHTKKMWVVCGRNYTDCGPKEPGI